MITFPHTKINLGLNVTERRKDGYHNIETVFYPLGLCDILEVLKSDKLSFSSSGLPIPGDTKDNLCLKAYHLLGLEHGLPPVNIHLHKVIPMGAGLGGGSSDGAHMIKLLNDLFELELSWGEMHHYARQLGSDCSFFISGKPSFAEGKGDDYAGIPLYLEDYFFVLVCPPVHVSTAEAYLDVEPVKPETSLGQEILRLPVNLWKEEIKNDFEKSVFAAHPEIGKIKEKLYANGALYASMSGSGAAVYGIFSTPVDLQKEFKDCFVWSSAL